MANISTLKNWGMGLVILGIMFGIGLAVLGGVQETVMDVVEADVQETFDAPAEEDLPETLQLTYDEAVDVHEVEYTDTDGNYAVLGTEYYTVYEDDGEVEVTGDENGELPSDYDDTSDLRVTYDNLGDGEASEGIGDAVEGLSEFTGWFPLIALVVVAAVIITLVQSGFGNNGVRRRARA